MGYYYDHDYQYNDHCDCSYCTGSDYAAKTDSDCVCHVVRRIVHAQNEARDDGCSSSCDRSIRQLQGSSLDRNNTTIPFMLYCSGSCEPFVGSGMFKASPNKRHRDFFGFVESPVFRATQFVKNSDCCVHLELLLPVSDGCEVKPCNTGGFYGARRFFPENTPVTDFIATGVCLTVDLNDFVGISCLDPIDPIY